LTFVDDPAALLRLFNADATLAASVGAKGNVVVGAIVDVGTELEDGVVVLTGGFVVVVVEEVLVELLVAVRIT
jgi:hypothetical protein